MHYYHPIIHLVFRFGYQIHIVFFFYCLHIQFPIISSFLNIHYLIQLIYWFFHVQQSHIMSDNQYSFNTVVLFLFLFFLLLLYLVFSKGNFLLFVSLSISLLLSLKCNGLIHSSLLHFNLIIEGGNFL